MSTFGRGPTISPSDARRAMDKLSNTMGSSGHTDEQIAIATVCDYVVQLERMLLALGSGHTLEHHQRWGSGTTT